jgi:hypothetical protein
MKFVGKFRKNKDYKDDYSYAKEFLNVKKTRIEHPERATKNRNWEDLIDNNELYEEEYDTSE